MKPRLLVLALLPMLLSACIGTGGLAPSATLRDPDRLDAAATLARATLSPAAWPAGDWWRGYSDAQLATLIAEALHDSPTIGVAQARIRQAQAAAAVTGASLSPQMSAGARTSRQRFTEHGAVPPALAGSWQWSNEATLNFGYEFDFWGKNRAALDGAIGRTRAAEVDAEAVRLLLTVGITQQYIRLAQLHAQHDVLETTLAQRQQIVELTRQRVAAHLDSQAELKQAELGIPAARAELAATREAIDLVKLQLAALAGAGPDRGERIERPQLRHLHPAALPAVLPSALLARRPDIVAQRWRVEALRRDIDAAHARFYPSFNLTALAGLQSLGFSRFLDAGSAIAGAGPSVGLPVFDGGRLRGNLALRNADYDVAVEGYNQAVIDALRDVSSQVTSLRWLEERLALQREATATAAQAHELAVQRYRAGLGNNLQVLTAQLQLLAQQRLQVELDARAFDLDLQLVRALGGGYRPSIDPAGTPALASKVTP